jgi:Ran GTPase-activating protein (RanGAP) involved in mRNA processing and transport
VGIAAICDTYLNQKGDMGVLKILNLSHNFIQSAGAERIGKLLRRFTEIEVFDISGNRLEDYGCTVIAEALIENPPEFIDDEEDVDSNQSIHGDKDLGLGYNRSLSALYLRDSDLGPLGVKALTDALERNKTLSTLNLEYNPLMTSESIKELMSIVSLNNHTLSRLSLAENPLTVKTLGYVLRAFEGKEVVLAHLDLSNCSLTSKHMSLFCKYGSCSCQYSDPNCSSSTHSLLTKLVSLNLTGNRFSDSGCFSLSSFLSGSSGRAEGIFKELEGISNSDVDDKSEFLRFSLRSLDLTDCAITSLGATAIFEAISTNTIFKRSSLVHLDLSDNPLGPGTFAPLPQKPTRKGSVVNRRDSWLVALVQARVRDLTVEDSQSLAIVNHAVSFSTPAELQPYGVATDIDVSKEALDRSECLQYLSCCNLLDLRLNRTNLCVESAISLFKVLGSVDGSFTGVSTLGRTLKALSLVSNNLYDGPPIIKTLVNVMSNNHTLELLDIGFNGFTSDVSESIKGSLLLSESHLKRRMSPLTVNVIGNKCEPYAVTVPLRHATLQYGLSSNSQSAYSGGGDIDRWTNISASILDRDEDGQTPALLPNIESDTLKSLALQSDLSHVPLDGKDEYLLRKIYLKAFNRDQAPPPSLSHTS